MPTDYRTQQDQIASQRAIAEFLRQRAGNPTAAQQGGYQGGKVYMVGSPLGSLAQDLGAMYMGSKADSAQEALSSQLGEEQKQFAEQFGAAPSALARSRQLMDAESKGLDTGMASKVYGTDQNVEAQRAAQQAALQRTMMTQQAQAQRDATYRVPAADQIRLREKGGDFEMPGDEFAGPATKTDLTAGKYPVYRHTKSGKFFAVDELGRQIPYGPDGGDGAQSVRPELATAARITREMAQKGQSEEEIRKMFMGTSLSPDEVDGLVNGAMAAAQQSQGSALPQATGRPILEPKQSVAERKEQAKKEDRYYQIQDAIDLAEGNPEAFGLDKALGDTVNQRFNPGGVEARAAVANLSSQIIHDRSGANVTAKEFPRLSPFIPNVHDNPAVVVTKLKALQAKMTERGLSFGGKAPPQAQAKQPVTVNSAADILNLESGTPWTSADGKRSGVKP